MCGIAALWLKNNDTIHLRLDQIRNALHPRGPDHYQQTTQQLGDHNENKLVMSASVLHLRGTTMALQPVMERDGSVLLWNGEVFGKHQDEMGIEHSDTLWVAEHLRKCETMEDFVQKLDEIQGPWAFVYWKESSQELFYGHDRLGRRSLLQMEAADMDVEFAVTSVAIDMTSQYTEVPCTGIFSYSHQSKDKKWAPWPELQRVPQCISHPVIRNEGLELSEDFCQNPQMLARAGELYHILSQAVKRRVVGVPALALGVLFSGGLDSVVIAALAHQHYPEDQPIELLNVCFDDKFQSPDRCAAEASFHEFTQLFPTREWRFVRINVKYEEVKECANEIKQLLMPCTTQMDFNIGSAFWFLSRGHGHMSTQISQENILTHSTLNSFLAKSGQLPSGPCPMPSCKKKAKPNCVYGICKGCCLKVQSSRLDPPSGEISPMPCPVHQKEHKIAQQEELPENQGEHLLSLSKPSKNYESQARVLLVGIGADEQLAGYSRHKTAFENGGEARLREELAKDMERIWKRNLGRDDRCISCHGREARFPYLDEEVVKYLQSIPLSEIANLDAPRGVGDKQILRVVGRHLGLHQCTHLAKRAIQFGTRIAKQTNQQCGMSNRSSRGTDSIN